ncbi:MAG TPA: endonuclease/exonuclease/phosphatase family protein [Candidatus Paceibacterota bacterium]|nr:endonuclease/exonuclease/phosphatase family protein [Candidatus Paceibacterota bacterium]
MKLITLNTWAGRLKEPFEQFLKEYAKETDIFCFQEIFNKYEEAETVAPRTNNEKNPNILQEIRETLPDFNSYFCPVLENVYGIAIFLKKGIEVIASGEVVLYTNPNYDPKDESSDHDRKMQWVHIKEGRKDLLIMNTHGHWDASGKGDTPNRIEQSKAINAFIESVGSTPKILVGDFNLNPETESIKLLEKYFINMITKEGVATTRTELYTGADRHADYVFVSPEVFVNQFKVLPDVVSDHAPLFIDFDLF